MKLTSPGVVRRGDSWTTGLAGIDLPGLHLRLV
jgi:hypothetical protein